MYPFKGIPTEGVIRLKVITGINLFCFQPRFAIRIRQARVPGQAAGRGRAVHHGRKIFPFFRHHDGRRPRRGVQLSFDAGRASEDDVDAASEQRRNVDQ